MHRTHLRLGAIQRANAFRIRHLREHDAPLLLHSHSFRVPDVRREPALRLLPTLVIGGEMRRPSAEATLRLVLLRIANVGHLARRTLTKPRRHAVKIVRHRATSQVSWQRLKRAQTSEPRRRAFDKRLQITSSFIRKLLWQNRLQLRAICFSKINQIESVSFHRQHHRQPNWQ